MDRDRIGIEILILKLDRIVIVILFFGIGSDRDRDPDFPGSYNTLSICSGTLKYTEERKSTHENPDIYLSIPIV